MRSNDRKNSRTTKYSYRKMRDAVKERDDFTCVQCGRSQYEGFAIEVDHVKPWYLGGTDTMDNLVTLCKDFCHKAKSAQEQRERLAKVRDGEDEAPWSRQWY